MRKLARSLAAVVVAFALVFTLSGHPQQSAEAANNVASFTGTFPRYLARGQSLAGLGQDVAYDWQDFTATTSSLAAGVPWQAGGVGTGAVALNPNVVGYRGGIMRITSGATAASLMRVYGNTTNVAHNGTDRWYVACRMKVQTAITAQSTVYCGLFGSLGNATVGVGVFGASSTVNFVVQYDGFETGTFLSTGVPIDTNFHVFELYVQGDSKVRCRVDGGNEINATMAGAAADAHAQIFGVKNGTDAVARNMDVDWMLIAAKRTP